MAAFHTKTLPPEAPTPALGEGWVPVTRYFGEGGNVDKRHADFDPAHNYQSGMADEWRD